MRQVFDWIGRVLIVSGIAIAVAQLAEARAQPAPLQFGVLPNLSARVIVESYQPFRTYLERRLGRAVEIVTAPSFKAYHANLMAGKYDLAVTAANLGRLAEIDAGHHVFAIYEPPIPGIVAVLRAKQIKSPAELRGKVLALANPQSLVAMKGMEWFAAQGLHAGTDFTTLHARNDDSLAQVLGSGEAPMAMMSLGEFRAIREELRKDLEILVELVRVPGFLALTGNHIEKSLAASIRDAVIELARHPEGEEFFRRSGFKAIRAVEQTELATLDSVLAETRRLMSQP